MLSAFTLALQAGGIAALVARPSSRGQNHETVAVCLSGTARTLVEPEVHESLQQFLQGLEARGVQSRSQPDVFAFLALNDAVAYAMLPRHNTTASDIKSTLAKLGVNSFDLVDDPMEVTQENVGEVIKHPKKCFNHFVDLETHPWRLPNALSQIIHMRKCFDLLKKQEEKQGEQYDFVIFTRPDLKYRDSLPNNLLTQVYEDSNAVIDSDHFLAMPRAMANGLEDHYTALVECSSGQPCCTGIKKPEHMFEFLFGFPVAYSGSCECIGDDRSPFVSVPKRWWDLYGENYNR